MKLLENIYLTMCNKRYFHVSVGLYILVMVPMMPCVLLNFSVEYHSTELAASSISWRGTSGQSLLREKFMQSSSSLPRAAAQLLKVCACAGFEVVSLWFCVLAWHVIKIPGSAIYTQWVYRL